MFHKTSALCVTVIAVLVMVGSAGAGQIYFDDFSGDANDDLNGTTPDVSTTGATWVARETYKADGSFTWEAFASMSLAFTPVDGLVYTLDAKFENVTGQHWVQFGFGNGEDPAWSGRAWHLLRVAEDGGNAHNTALNGFAGLTAWSDLALLRYDEPLDARIVLDTTGGTGDWLATFYAKADSDLDYTEVREETPLTAEDIDSVGFGVFNTQKTGKLLSFSLSDNTADDLQGDADENGVVDAADYIALKRNMGLGSGAELADGDFDDNGTVDWDDLQILIAAFDAGDAAQAVPEPATLGLLAIGAMAILRRRRRS